MGAAEYDFSLRAKGKKVCSGDGLSLRVFFNNLTGCNFDRLPSPTVNHRDWLLSFCIIYETDLSLLDKIELLSPAGEVLESAFIGICLPRETPKVGDACWVRLPDDRGWVDMRLIGRADRTCVNRELYYFMSAGMCHSVDGADLSAHVFPCAMRSLS